MTQRNCAGACPVLSCSCVFGQMSLNIRGLFWLRSEFTVIHSKTKIAFSVCLGTNGTIALLNRTDMGPFTCVFEHLGPPHAPPVEDVSYPFHPVQDQIGDTFSYDAFLLSARRKGDQSFTQLHFIGALILLFSMYCTCAHSHHYHNLSVTQPGSTL